MAVLRKRGKTYEIDYRVNGKRVRKSVGSNKKFAELALKEIEVKLAKGELGFDQKDILFERLIAEYRKYCQTNLSANTKKRYKAILDNFQRFLDSEYSSVTKVSQFHSKLFEDFKSFRKTEKAHPETINKELIVVSMVFRLAVQWGYLTNNPTDGVSKLKLPKKNPPRFLSEKECEALLGVCDEWLYPIFYTFLSTGMRKSELEYLEWSDVDFGRKKIKISIKDEWSPKTNEREIPISERLLEILKKQRNTVQGSKYVFPDESGGQIYKNRLRKRLMSLTKQLGIPEVTKIHTLRHTFASHLVMKGVDLPTLKKLMGHADIETTMIYSHLTDRHVNEAVEKLDF